MYLKLRKLGGLPPRRWGMIVVVLAPFVTGVDVLSVIGLGPQYDSISAGLRLVVADILIWLLVAGDLFRERIGDKQWK